MSAVCPAVLGDAGVVERLAGYVECQSQQIDLAAFHNGLWHGLPAALVTVLMVLYVAGFGYRLILQHRLDTATVVYTTLRLGAVIAVTTTFSAYSTLVYTVSSRGPAEVAAMALAPAGLHAPSLTEAGHAAAGYLETMAGPAQTGPAPAPAPPPPSVNPNTGPQVSTSTPPPASAGPGRDTGSAIFLLSCVGFALAARLAQAVVLAVGPLFIAAALFDVSSGLFFGWLRALAALFLAQTGYAVSMAIELAFFAHDAEHLSQTPDPGAPLLIGLFFLTAGAGITVIAVLAAGGMTRVSLFRRIGAAVASRTTAEPAPAPRSPWAAPEIRVEPPVSRVQRVADAVGTLAMSEAQRQNGGQGPGGSPGSGSPSGAAGDSLANGGPGLRRPGQLRASTGAAKRDLIS